MFLQRGSRVLQTQWQMYKGIRQAAAFGAARRWDTRGFHGSRSLRVVKPVLLADIGEGIVECEVIQWFVEPGARVEEFSPLCEVQSDKASVEITSRFAGVVKKLYYEAGEMARVGKPYVDIDIQGDVKKEDLEALTPPEPAQDDESQSTDRPPSPKPPPPQQPSQASSSGSKSDSKPITSTNRNEHRDNDKHASLATPAVRHLSREHDIDICQIAGTGKDGRVLKEDIYKFIENRDSTKQQPASSAGASGAYAQQSPPEAESGVQTETRMQLTNTQQQMFKAMTRSLTIPHFLYADEIDFTSLVELRGRLNKVLSQSTAKQSGDVRKLSYLPFIIKAVSMALYQYPILNARVDVDASTGKPSLIHRSQHNMGVAMDTPSGLVVPVIKGVNSRNVLSIASELVRLQTLALAGRLSPQDMGGGTLTVSNIGNIGGTYLSPVIVEKEVAILGIGRMRTVPAFDERDQIVKRQICNFSWSADHRVVDGATLARAAGVVRQLVEEPEVLIMQLR